MNIVYRRKIKNRKKKNMKKRKQRKSPGTSNKKIVIPKNDESDDELTES